MKITFRFVTCHVLTLCSYIKLCKTIQIICEHFSEIRVAPKFPTCVTNNLKI
ncbi:unnamed protein product [Phyllotreta striolata]|uniref:Uncharacterized protein n=1 Tax=Phyllotreta striolata TaxID=444603 RepID=A0A9N9XJ48_PHYSR|nr:unnamed protein product [Phyllotreta striolata]